MFAEQMEKAEQAGREALMRMTPSDKALFKFINSKIEECVKEERQASLEGDWVKSGQVTIAYFRLLGQAFALGMKYLAC